MNYHYRYRLGAPSRPFISIDSQLPSRKSFEINFLQITVTVTVLKCFWIRKVIISNMTVKPLWPLPHSEAKDPPVEHQHSQIPNKECSLKTFGGPTGPFPLDLPLWARPPPSTSAQTWFGPDFDPKKVISGPNQVKIGSKSGLRGGAQRRCSKGVGREGPKVLNVALKSPKISLIKRHLADLRAAFLRDSCSFDVLWASWGFWVTGALQSFYNGRESGALSRFLCFALVLKGFDAMAPLSCGWAP